MLLKVRNELSGSNLPNSDFSLLSSSYEKFIVVSHAESCDTILMCLVYHPERLWVFNSETSDFAIWPSTENNFICKGWAVGINVARALSSTPSKNWVVVAIPESDRSVFWASWKFIWNSWHKIGMQNWFCVVLTEKHFLEVWNSDSVDETFISRTQKLDSVFAHT